jgi:PST family polysaccharide transporter
VAFGQLTSASLLGQAIGFAVLALVARRVGAARLGDYGFAVNLISYFWLPVAGVGGLAVRDVARRSSGANTASGTVLRIISLYSAVVGIAVYVLAPDIAPTPLSAAMLRIAAAMQITSLLSLEWLLQARQSFGRLAWARLSGQIVYGVAAVLLIGSGTSGLYRYAWLNVLGVGVTVGIASVYAIRATGWPSLHVPLRRVISTLRESVPFTVSLVMITVYFSADFVLLGFLRGSRDVGQYVVAYKIPAALLGLGSAWVGVFFPHAARETAELLRRQIGQSTTLSLILFIPVCMGSFVVGHPLIVLLFGAQYAPAGLYFELLMLATLFGIADANIGQVLLARDEHRRFAVNVTVGAIVNVALNLILIPPLGPAGSATATVAAEFIVLGLMAHRLTNAIGKPPIVWRRVLAAVVSAGAMTIVLLVVGDQWPVVARICLGATVFGALAIVTGAVKLTDRRYLRRSVATG